MQSNILNNTLGSSWHSYPKIWSLGHSAIRELLLDEVIIQEKVDGSQFSFGVFNGEIKVRSKGKEINVDFPEKLFTKAIDTVKTLAPVLINGYTYRGEFLATPKHNVLAYDRIPSSNIILFDINTGQESYLTYEQVVEEAKRIGLEVVPLLYKGKVSDATQLLSFLDNTSVLGGQKIEGFVIKNYSRFGIDGKVLMGKHVSESFKEVHAGEWKAANPQHKDVIMVLGQKYTTPARWNKAVQHLKEKGQLTDSPKDIGLLMKEVNVDVLTECKEEIKEYLFQWAWNSIARQLTRGLPEWYKEELLKKQFDK